MLRIGRHDSSLHQGNHRNNLISKSVSLPGRVQEDAVRSNLQNQSAQIGISFEKYHQKLRPLPLSRDRRTYWEPARYTPDNINILRVMSPVDDAKVIITFGQAGPRMVAKRRRWVYYPEVISTEKKIASPKCPEEKLPGDTYRSTTQRTGFYRY